MERSADQLQQWVDLIAQYEPAPWDRLPELELYMDQVITFMNRQLEPFGQGGERMLTPSMINNYVKDGVLPRPEKKKYSRDHLALLLVICTLKSVLSLPQIDAIIRGLTEGLTVEEQYPAFVGAHEKSLEEVTERLRSAATRDKAGKYRLAVQLALEANARRTAAARIIDSLNNSDPAPDKEKEKDKTKEK